MILDSTTKTLELVLGAAVTTTAMPITVDYVDNTSTTFTPGSVDSASNGTTAVTILSAPAASTQRKVNYISVYNADSAAKLTTVRLNNNATLRPQIIVTLQVGDTLGYTDVSGWYVMDSAGAIKGVGPTGATGATGAPGVNGGIGMPGADGNDGEDGMAIPGNKGDTGLPGGTGPQGPIGIGLSGDDGEDGMAIPGPVGPAGAAGAAGASGMQTITVTMAANAATIASLNSTPLVFRSATATDGSTSTVNTPSANLVIPSGASLGSTNAIAATYIIVEMNNAGTREFAICNQSGGLQCDEKNLISTTAISAAATSASVWYSTTARTNLPYRVIGTFTATEATAGTWATAASAVQAAFGEALTAMSSLGYGQTWHSVTASRAVGTTYYSGAKPIEVSIALTSNPATPVVLTVGGVTAAYAQYAAGASIIGHLKATIPPYTPYVLTGANQTITQWSELY